MSNIWLFFRMIKNKMRPLLFVQVGFLEITALNTNKPELCATNPGWGKKYTPWLIKALNWEKCSYTEDCIVVKDTFTTLLTLPLGAW